MEYKIDYNTLLSIEKALAKHKRVEVIPTKDGIVVLEIKRSKLKIENT